MEGLVIFNKPRGVKSTEVVNYFKKKLKTKVGHGGTLDPLATGLLIIGIAEHTKDLKFFLTQSKKTYLVEAILGLISTSYDLEGDLSFGEGKLPNIKQVNLILEKFQGESYQLPPLFSAVKIKGLPLYKLARRQKVANDFSLRPRKIKIEEIKLLNYQELFENNFKHLLLNKKDIKGNWRPLAKIKFRTTVSAGTYIRSLVNDLGSELGCGACLSFLERIEICLANENFFKKYGRQVFPLNEALTFNDFERDFFELQAKVFGLVQGVNFRFSVSKLAKELNLIGWVKNREDGSVEVLAQGGEVNLQKLISFLKKGPSLAKVDEVKIIWSQPLTKFKDFFIAY